MCAFNLQGKFGLFVHPGDPGRPVLVREDLDAAFQEGILEETTGFGAKSLSPSETQIKWEQELP